MRLKKNGQARAPGARKRLVSPQHHEWEAYICLGSVVWLAVTHWVEGRSVECTGEWEVCPNCRPGGSPRETGYLHAFHAHTGGNFFLVLPQGTVHALQNSIAANSSLRGRKIELRRHGSGKEGALHVRVDPIFHWQHELAPEQDPTPVVTQVMEARRRLTKASKTV